MSNRAMRRVAARDIARAESWEWKHRPFDAELVARVAPHIARGEWGEPLGGQFNSFYIVLKFKRSSAWGDLLHLAIRRVDGGRQHAASADIPWRDKQRIKDEVAGPERVALEVFPERSQLVDAANMFHLWVLPDGFNLPVSI